MEKPRYLVLFNSLNLWKFLPPNSYVSLLWIKNVYGLKDAVLNWFEKLKEVMEARGFVQYQVYLCVWYREEMVLLFYVHYCLMFISTKDKIDDVYD